jgi:transcriptional regulator with XRE-family HTH domain
VTSIDLIPQPHFGERLRRLRQQCGLKQTDLADEGLSASYVSRIESGNRPVTPHVAQVLAERLGVDITAFQSDREIYLARLLADGQSSLAAGNHAAAATAFEAALDQAVDAPLATAWLIRHSLTIALSNLGRLADWRRHQSELVNLANEATSPDLLTQAHTGMSNCLRLSGEVSEAYVAARAARDHSRDADVSPGHQLQATMAMIAAETETGRAADSTRHAEELLGLLDEDTPAPLRAQALWAAASTYVARGRHDEAIELLMQAIHGLDSGEDLVTWARLRLAVVSLAHRAGHTAEAESCASSFREAAHVLRLTAIPIYQAQLDVIEARIAFEKEHFAEARTLCEAALARADLLSFRDTARAQMLWAQATGRTGEPDKAIADLRAVAERLDEAGARDLSAEAWRLVAELALTDRDAPS